MKINTDEHEKFEVKVDPAQAPDCRSFTQDDRDFLEGHFRAIAERIIEKGARSGWRARRSWSIEIDGCVFYFKVAGYTRKGSVIDRDRKAAALVAAAEFEAEYGPVLDRMKRTSGEYDHD